MARVEHCGVWNHAKQYRLVSNVPAYEFQILYHIPKCKGHYRVGQMVNLCTEMHLQWRGEYSNGAFTEFFDIHPHAHQSWLKRAESDKARPEAQMVSEYTEQMCRSPESFGKYLAKLEREASRWWQGKRIEVVK